MKLKQMINRFYKNGIERMESIASSCEILLKREETELSEIVGNCLSAGNKEDYVQHEDKDVIMYVTQGAGVLQLGESSHALNKGNLLYIPAGKSYLVSATNDMGFGYVQFSIFNTVNLHFKSPYTNNGKDTAAINANRKGQNVLAKPILFSNPDQGKVYEFGSNTTTLLLERNQTNYVELALICWFEGRRGAMAAHKDKEQCFYVLSGRGEITVDGITQDVRPGHVVFVPRNTPHTTLATKGELVYICLNSLANPSDESFDTMYKRIIPGRMKRYEDGTDEVGE